MLAADTEAMSNQLTEQSVDGPQRCFSAPAVMRGQKEKKQSPLTTWGGCQGIKYCSEFQYEIWNESELQLIHWEERSRLQKQIGRERLQRECEQMTLQGEERKPGSVQTFRYNSGWEETCNWVVSYIPSPVALEGHNLHSCSPPCAQHQERTDQGCTASLFLLASPLPTASGNTQSTEGQHLLCKQKQSQQGNIYLLGWVTQSHTLVPHDNLKLEFHVRKGTWKAPHQAHCLLRSICGSEQNSFPYTLYYGWTSGS